MEQKFPVELVEPVPARHIAADALFRRGHAQVRFRQRLLELRRESDRLIYVLIRSVPVALAAGAHPAEDIGGADGLGRHGMHQRADNVPVDLLEMVGGDEIAEVASLHIVFDTQHILIARGKSAKRLKRGAAILPA